MVGKKEQFHRNLEARVGTTEKELKAVLPPMSEDKQTAIQEPLQKGKHQAVKELSPDETDQYEQKEAAAPGPGWRETPSLRNEGCPRLLVFQLCSNDWLNYPNP